MAHHNLKPTENDSVTDGNAATVETDWSAVAAEMSAAAATETGPLGVRELQDRAASAISGPETVPDTATGTVLQPWPARRQLAFFLGAGALCWMLILVPVLL